MGMLLLFCWLDLYKINTGSRINLLLTAMLYKLIFDALVCLQHSAVGFDIDPTL